MTFAFLRAPLLAALATVSILATPAQAAPFTGLEVLEALATVDGDTGVADPLNDGMTFFSSTSATSEGTATNAGAAGASSFAATSLGDGGAFTLWGAELAGPGTYEIDLEFSLFVDLFDSDGGLAVAGFEVFGDFGSHAEELLLAGAVGMGDALSDHFLVTLTADLTGGIPGFFGVTTYANVFAPGGGAGSALADFLGVTDVRLVAVPEVPAVGLLVGGLALLALRGRRRTWHAA